MLIPRRLEPWPLGGLPLLPWFLALGGVARDMVIAGWCGWRSVYGAALTGGIVMALYLSPELGFLLLVPPLFPIVLQLHAAIVSES